MAKNASQFAKGSGCYTCRSCGRNTRATGRGDNENAQLCAECYDLAGIENAFQDSDERPQTYLEEAARLYLRVKELGGDPCFDFMDDIKPFLPGNEAPEAAGTAAEPAKSERTEAVMLPADAIKFMKNRRSKGRASFLIAVGQQAPIEGKPDRVFPVMSYVEVTLKEAIKFIESAYSPILVERGARIRIAYSSDSPCVFIGNAA